MLEMFDLEVDGLYFVDVIEILKISYPYRYCQLLAPLLNTHLQSIIKTKNQISSSHLIIAWPFSIDWILFCNLFILPIYFCMFDLRDKSIPSKGLHLFGRIIYFPRSLTNLPPNSPSFSSPRINLSEYHSPFCYSL